MADTPLAVTIEFARATETHDPFAFAEGKQDYVVRLEGASFRQVSLHWGPKLFGALEQVRLPRRDRPSTRGSSCAPSVTPSGDCTRQCAEGQRIGLERAHFLTRCVVVVPSLDGLLLAS